MVKQHKYYPRTFIMAQTQFASAINKQLFEVTFVENVMLFAQTYKNVSSLSCMLVCKGSS